MPGLRRHRRAKGGGKRTAATLFGAPIEPLVRWQTRMSDQSQEFLGKRQPMSDPLKVPYAALSPRASPQWSCKRETLAHQRYPTAFAVERGKFAVEAVNLFLIGNSRLVRQCGGC